MIRRSYAALAATIISLSGGLAYGQTTELKKRNRYDSRYLVTVDPDRRQILALDFNRTELGDSGRVQLEYKGWTATGGDWTMFVYED